MGPVPDCPHWCSANKSRNQQRSNRVKSFSNPGRFITNIILFLASAAISVCFSTPSNAQASPSLPCSWPVEVTGKGTTNEFNPDTDATYWLMPVDTTQWTQMSVAGEYPTARFFSFVTYLEKGGAVDSIIDANLIPDPGSTNPFQPGSTFGPHRYTLTIDGSPTGSGNHIQWGDTQSAYIIYRVYVPDLGKNREGSVPLPAVTLVDANGNAYPLPVCASSATPSASTSSGQLPGLDALTASESAKSDATTSTSCPSGEPPSEVITFVPNTSHGGVFPNPATVYVAARGLCSQPGQVIVIRGKAAVYPNTYYGGSIFQPAIPGQIQLRYWSLCNNKEVIPYPVVDCRADHATRLDRGYYTYVLAPDGSGTTGDLQPSWVPPDTTWLRWGDPSVIHDLLFRVMLPMPGFALSGDYFPRGVYCNEQLLVTQGWQACFAAAGVTTQ
jgi:hypothetical protein